MAFASGAGTEPGLSARQEVITRLSRALNAHCVLVVVFVLFEVLDEAFVLPTVLLLFTVFAFETVLELLAVFTLELFAVLVDVCEAEFVLADWFTSESLPSRRRNTGASLSVVVFPATV